MGRLSSAAKPPQSLDSPQTSLLRKAMKKALPKGDASLVRATGVVPLKGANAVLIGEDAGRSPTEFEHSTTLIHGGLSARSHPLVPLRTASRKLVTRLGGSA